MTGFLKGEGKEHSKKKVDEDIEVRCSIMEAFSWVCDFSWLFVLDMILKPILSF